MQAQQIECVVCMSQFEVVSTTVAFTTKSAVEFTDLTGKVDEAVAASRIQEGIVHVFAPHATGILILTENDPALLGDIRDFLEKLAPEHDDYAHPDNAHAHLRSLLFPPDRTLPVVGGRVAWGTWQSLLFVETDVYPRKRTVIIQVMGKT